MFFSLFLVVPPAFALKPSDLWTNMPSFDDVIEDLISDKMDELNDQVHENLPEFELSLAFTIPAGEVEGMYYEEINISGELIEVDLELMDDWAGVALNANIGTFDIAETKFKVKHGFFTCHGKFYGTYDAVITRTEMSWDGKTSTEVTKGELNLEKEMDGVICQSALNAIEYMFGDLEDVILNYIASQLPGVMDGNMDSIDFSDLTELFED